MTTGDTTAPKKSGMAIASLIFGILSFFCLGPLAGIPAIILGIVAMGRIKRDPIHYGGHGASLAGIITGAIGCVMGLIIPLLIAILLPSLSRAREIANRAADASNLRQIGTALQVYATGSLGQFPPSMAATVIEGTTPQNFVAKSTGTTPPSYTAPVSDWTTLAPEIESHTDWIYTGTGLKNISDPEIILVYTKDIYGHQGRNVLFTDGHVEFVRAGDLASCFAANNAARARTNLNIIDME